MSPALAELVPYVADKNLVWALGAAVVFCSIGQSSSSIISVYRKLGFIDFFKIGVPELMPLFQWVLASTFLFLNTEWAWEQPHLALLVLLPSFCLINSKMIVCNVTGMQAEMNSWSFTWFMLFPLNKAQGRPVPEWALALLIFAINFTTYMTFVVCTINQICKLLDINCLTIKEKKV